MLRACVRACVVLRACTRGVQQRQQRRKILTSRVNGSIHALNDMMGGSRKQFFGAGCLVAASDAQQAVLSNLWRVHADCVPDSVPTPREAFVELRGQSSSVYELPSNLAGYRKGSISMPDCKDWLAPLLELLPEEDRVTIANFEQDVLRCDKDVEDLNSLFGQITPYFDPAFQRSWRLYADFVRKLHKGGMVRWGLSRKERVTPFFCKKEVRRPSTDHRLSEVQQALSSPSEDLLGLSRLHDGY